MLRNGASAALFVVLALVVAVPAPAQDEDRLTSERRARVDRLIARLGGDSFEERESSFAELVAMGPAIRPLVEEARDRAGLEVRLRLESLLEAIGGSVEVVSTSLEPTLVTLVAEDATLASATAQLERQGVRFHQSSQASPDERVDLVLRDRPLLEVLDALGDELSMRWGLLPRDGAVRFVGRSAGKPLRYYAGPMRLMLTRATRNSTRVFGEDLVHTCYVQGVIDLEPHAPVLGLWHPPVIDEMTSPAGTSLIDDSVAQRRNFNAAAHRSSFHFSARVRLPGEHVEKIARMAGRIEVAVAKEYQVLSLPLPADETSRSVTVGAVKATLESSSRTETGWQLVVTLERDAVMVDQERRQSVSDQLFELVTTSGRTAVPVSRPQPRVEGRRERFELDFETDAAPESLTVRSLKSIERREVPFELTDVPLP